MNETSILRGAESEIDHVGIVVKDLDKAVTVLTALGLGPFTVKDVCHPVAIVHGKKVSYNVRIAISQQGPVELELIEHVSGETIHHEFLKEKGEGLHHIRFTVNDINATLDKFVQKGMNVLQQDEYVGGGGFAYLNIAEIGGIIIELFQLPPDYNPEKGLQYVPE